MEQAVSEFLRDIFAARPTGQVVAVPAPGQILLRFPAPPPPDAEYLIARSAAGQDVPQTVGAVRIVGGPGDRVRAAVLWSDGALRAEDVAAWPSRIAIVLLPTQAEEGSGLDASARRLDSWLELQLLSERRLRVIGADTPEGERWRIQQLRDAREYGLTIAPLLVSGDEGVAVTLRVRSVFTGQTLAERHALWAPAAARATPGPSPPAPPSVGAPPQAGASPGAPARPPAVASLSPYGTGIRASGIERAAPDGGHYRVPLAGAAKALALGDVDGDGRLEVVTITDRQVLVYRWTGRDVTQLTTSDPLPVFTTYLHVDATDLDGDGRAEIVLGAIRGVPRGNEIDNRVLAEVVRMRGGRLEQRRESLERHLRVLAQPGRPSLLLAQALGAHELASGPVQVVEWAGGSYRLGREFPLPAGVPSLYGFARADLDGDRQDEVARVADDGRFWILDEQGHPRWEDEEDLGALDARGFAQTPRDPDYRGRNFDASAEQLAVWRALPRRVLVVSGPAGAAEVVTVANPRPPALRASRRPDLLHGRAVGYGWDAEGRRFARRWESAEVAGQALDVAVGALEGGDRLDLVVLSAAGERRFLDVFTLRGPVSAGAHTPRR